MSCDRFIRTLIPAAASALSGLVGAFLVWNFIYGIGSRVVTDQTYGRLESSVCWSGCAAGLVIGCLTPAVRRRQFSLRSLIAAHAAAVICGFMGGASRWDTGLFAYFGALAAFQGFMLWRAMFDFERVSG